MMPTKPLFLLVFFIIASGLVLIFNPSESAIPPTPAYETIEVVSDTNPITSQVNRINATTYQDTLFLSSDGSILLNFTQRANP